MSLEHIGLGALSSGSLQRRPTRPPQQQQNGAPSQPSKFPASIPSSFANGHHDQGIIIRSDSPACVLHTLRRIAHRTTTS